MSLYRIFTKILMGAALAVGTTSTTASQDFRVEGAGLEAEPTHYVGPCPAKVNFNGKIQASGAGRVKYTYSYNDGAAGPEGYIDFTSPGVQHVSTIWQLGDASLAHYEGWAVLKIVYPNATASNTAKFVVDCKPAAPDGSNNGVAEKSIGDPRIAVLPLPATVIGSTTRKSSPDPCAALTPAAIQSLIDAIARSRAKAERDSATNGTTGAYASAARDNLTYLRNASDEWLFLQNWLRTNHVDTSVDGRPYVTNQTAAYNIHSYARDTLYTLHHARHWAAISAVYHRSTDARDSFELTSQAIDLIEAVGVQGGRCYVSAYLP